jgi:hypothetical protein
VIVSFHGSFVGWIERRAAIIAPDGHARSDLHQEADRPAAISVNGR